MTEPKRAPPWDEFPDKGSTWRWCLEEHDALFDLTVRLGEALANVLDVSHEKGCEFRRSALHVCTRGCFRRAPENARVVLADYRRMKEGS